MRHGISSIRKILDQQIRNGIVAVDDVKDLEAGPDIIEAGKRGYDCGVYYGLGDKNLDDLLSRFQLVYSPGQFANIELLCSG